MLVAGLWSLGVLAGCGAPDRVLVDVGDSVGDNGDAVVSDGTFSEQRFRVLSVDGTSLEARAWVPNALHPGAKFPAILFVNSWAFNSHEYTAPAVEFAKQGYIVVAYCTRGFGSSGGSISVAGPADLADLAAVLDWVEARTPVNADAIGMAGISYGAGISLLGAALEPRVKVVVAMSGFTDLDRALDGNDTPRLLWGLLLLGSGEVLGRMDPAVPALYQDVLANRRIPEGEAFLALRSPITYLAALNASRKPLYLSNNLQDELFQPNPVLDFYAAYQGPKRLDLNRGMHGSAELPGLLGFKSFLWDNAHAWFDHYLMHRPNGIERAPPVTMQHNFDDARVSFEAWPSASVTAAELFLTPRSFLKHGTLSPTATTEPQSEHFESGIETVASSGFPVLSSVLEAHTPLRVHAIPDLMNPLNGVVYVSAPYPLGLSLRGKSSLHLRASAAGGAAMLVVYLYDVGKDFVGTLLSSGVRTLRGADGAPPQELDVDLSALVHDLPPGHQLGVAVDTVDILYAPPSLLPHRVDLWYGGEHAPSLTLQVAK